MIARRAHLVLLAALTLGGCLTPEERADRAVQDATDAMNAAAADAQAAAEHVMIEEFRVVARRCDLRTATPLFGMEGLVMSLPAELYALRDREPTAGRIACIARWAAEYHYELSVVEARN